LCTGSGFALASEPGIGIPAGIEQHEERLDVVSRGDVEKAADSFAKACRILLPRQVVQEHRHRLHAESFGPPSSLSIVARSNVSACHISSSLIAFAGMSLLPTSHGCFAYHSLAFASDQRPAGACDRASVQTQLIKQCDEES
jgi:hypothetical protein